MAADIGGTNARYQLWASGQERRPRLVAERTLQTSEHATFPESLAAFLAGQPQPDAACLAVAGPVTENRASLTNATAWEIDAQPLRQLWRTPAVRVVNDFEAVGFAVLSLLPDESLALHDAPAVPRAPIAVVGPGTGA